MYGDFFSHTHMAGDIVIRVPLRAESLQTSKRNAAILYVIFGANSGPLRYDKN